MAIDFPASPTIGDTFVVGTVTYTWDGTKWTAIAGDATPDKIEEGNTSAEVIDTGSDGRFVVTTDGTEALRVTNQQRVGIGTASPTHKLNLGGSGRSTVFVQSTDNFSELKLGSGQVNYITSDSTDLSFYVNGSEAARIDTSRRLLVGTSSTAANAAFQVQGIAGNSSVFGVIRTQRGSTPADGDELGYLTFGDKDSANSAATIYAARDGGTWTSGTSMPTRLVFNTCTSGSSSPTEHMRITAVGGLKVSTTGSYISSTSGRHEFNQTVSNTEALYLRNTNANPFGMTINYSGAAPNGTGNEFLYCFDGTLRARIQSNGGLANYQSNDSNLCDEREKKNIEALDSTWGCLKNWELKKFHYNGDADTDDKRYGVIAQQVAPHCPEVITEWVKQKAEDAVLDDDGNVVTEAKEEIVRMGVKEQQMMWMAIKALQEAQTRIETLEAEVAALKGA